MARDASDDPTAPLMSSSGAHGHMGFSASPRGQRMRPALLAQAADQYFMGA